MTLSLLLSLALVPQGDGQLSGAAMVLWSKAVGLTPEQGRFKAVGYSANAPGPIPVEDGRPNFSDGATPWALAGLEVDAISSNTNWIASSGQGFASATVQGGQGWAGFAFSVTPTTAGESGSVFQNGGPHVGAHMYQFMYPDSEGIAPDLRGKAVLATSSSGIRLEGAAPDIVAFDLIVPPVLGKPTTFPALISGTNKLAFSVPSSEAPHIPPSWFGGNTVLQSGATVWQTDWNGQYWSTPVALVAPSQVGLEQEDEIDAFAWDEVHGFALYSTTRDEDDPILFLNLVTETWGAFRISETVTVSQAIGIRPPPIRLDDVNAISAIDPRLPDVQKYIGTPETASPINASFFLDFESTGPNAGESLVALTSGLPPAGNATLSALVYWVNGAGPYLHTTKTGFGGTRQWRWPSAPVTGQTIEIEEWLFDSGLNLVGASRHAALQH